MKIILAIAILSATSCTLSVAPDGSRVWSVNGVEAARVIRVINEK